MAISDFKRKNALKREWDALMKREQAYLTRQSGQKESALNRLLADKVPDKLQATLDAAFEKAFTLIFEKGTGIIEKTCNKTAIENRYKLNSYADNFSPTRKTLRAFSKDAKRAGGVNLLISGLSGVGLGLFGVGLPDIPLFTAMLLKSIYEIALSYGFSYDTPQEKYFILLVIEGALSHGEHLDRVNAAVDAFICTPRLSENPPLQSHIKSAAAGLSKELLYMKFLQGAPIVGAVGGAYDAIYINQVASYARLKYEKRFLYDKMRGIHVPD